MKKSSFIILGIFFAVIILVLGIIGVHNAHNQLYQGVKAGKSHYSAALNVVPEKIKGVWTMSQQYMDHESKVFREYAEARNGALSAIESFKNLEAQGGMIDTDMVKKAQMAAVALSKLQSASLAINVQVENNPQLQASQTTMSAMRAMEEGVNEVKTALNDWIFGIKDYNQYAGNFFPGLWRGMFWNGKFPSEIQYYEGDVSKLDIGTLNPQTQK